MAVTQTQVIELYIATFGRAPDADGLDYWLNDSGLDTLAKIGTSMFDAPETKALYPVGITEEAFVTDVYNNIFGRAPTEADLDYWVDDGAVPRPNLIQTMIEAAKESSNEDAEYIDNRVQVAQAFVDAGLNDVDQAKAVLAPVTGDDATVAAGMELVESFIGTGTPLKLTTLTDVITDEGHTSGGVAVEAIPDELGVKLSNGNDVITGEAGTLQAADSIVDASTDDSDSLTVALNGNLGSADTNITAALNPTDGPTITNIEEITFKDDPDEVGVINISNVTGTKKMTIDSDQAGAVFTSDNDNLTNLEIRGLDGDEVEELIAGANRNSFAVSEIENKADITLHDNFTSLAIDALDSSKADEDVTVNMKGADFTIALYDDMDDNEDANANGKINGAETIENDGGSFAQLTLVGADNASTITIAEGTSLNNRTDSTTLEAGAAVGATKDANNKGGGTDATGTEGSMQLIALNDGNANSLLASSVVLEGDQDITLVGTGIQFDEAVITETTDDDLTSTINLTIGNETAASDAAGKAEIKHPIDLTAAEVDRVVISAQGDVQNKSDDDDIALVDKISEYMEVNVDENTIAEVTAITNNDALVITGDSATDTLQIALNMGSNAASAGTLILGGDASATTSEDTLAAGAGAGDGAGGAAAAPDTVNANADTAEIEVMSNSNLQILDVSQLTADKFTITGSSSLTIDELVMGAHGPHAVNDSATFLDATAMTGSLTINLSLDNNYTGKAGGHDDGNLGDADTDADNNGTADAGSGVQLELGSGRDFVGNAGVVAAVDGGYDFGDNIHLGAGNDIIEIGSVDDETGIQANDAVSLEVVGGDGDDTFIFQSTASTDEGQLIAGKQDIVGPLADKGGNAEVSKAHANETGVSLVRIKDFDTGANADKIKFNLFNEYSKQPATTDKDDDAQGSIYQSGLIVEATSTDMIRLDDGELVFISVADIDGFDAEDALGLFGDDHKNKDANGADAEHKDGLAPHKAFADPDVSDADDQENYDEYIFVVGETAGNDGVKIFYVREGHEAAKNSAESTIGIVDDIAVTLIGQVFNNANGNTDDFNITTLDDSNFAFL